MTIDKRGPGSSKGRRTGVSGCASGEGNDPGAGATSGAYRRDYAQVASMTVGDICDALHGQNSDALLAEVIPFVGRYLALMDDVERIRSLHRDEQRRASDRLREALGG